MACLESLWAIGSQCFLDNKAIFSQLPDLLQLLAIKYSFKNNEKGFVFGIIEPTYITE